MDCNAQCGGHGMQDARISLYETRTDFRIYL